ncbi:MBL fold metallo-hydrolase [Sphingomonas azotifigens]|uniref:MBL fold metallo-hydrolase n=1 Tax=Sphingomonas azotifigens TaxID=330920 RepID=UPI0009FEAC10|nr:MBL fold metallo-hydrolase [Sphingomonas azotifigens]
MKNAEFRRRMTSVAALVAGLCAPGIAAAQQTPYDTINAAAAASEITATPLRGGVVLLQGSGGNMVAMPGPDGLLMIDDGIALSKAKVEAKLHEIQPTGIRYAVNTHWHWDHTDGNVWVHDDGATIIAQANTARHFGETIRVVEWGHTFTPLPAGGRAAMLVAKEKTLAYGTDVIRLRAYMPSHTDGDLSAYFTRADVLLTGDTYWNGLYPFIDYVAGGSIDGMIAAADANIAMAGEKTIVVPGHGPLGTRADLIAYRDMLVTIRTNVAALKKQGKTLEEAIAARPTAAFDAKWGQMIISPALFTTLVYRGV